MGELPYIGMNFRIISLRRTNGGGYEGHNRGEVKGTRCVGWRLILRPRPAVALIDP